MGLNDLMHPRNRYKDNPPDFNELAAKYPEFKNFARQTSAGYVTINFKDPEALRALTCCTLDHDFGLKLDLPLDRLIPTVPLRLNYVLWLEDLLECLPSECLTKPTWGVDIGTGTSCIYPLLGTCLDGWHFIATEIDETAVKYAQKNVTQNGMDDKINVKLVTPDCFLQKPLEDVEQKIAFCMCNPPFFSSEEEASMGAARTDKRPLPTTVCTGSTNETVTGGGEVEFVKGIIKDSLALREKISWYTTMLGKKSSVNEVLAHLKKNKIYSVTTTEFCQGKTRRWGVAWTFLESIITAEFPPAKRHKRHHKTKPLMFSISCCASDVMTHIQQTSKRIRELLTDLKIDIQEESPSAESTCCDVINHVTYHCIAMENTWSNQRRKRREQQRQGRLGSSTTSSAVPEPVAELLEDGFSVETGSSVQCKGNSEKNLSDHKDNGTKTKTLDLQKSTSEKAKNSDKELDGKPSLESADVKLQETGLEPTNQPSPLCAFSIWVKPGAVSDEDHEGVRVGFESRDRDKNQLYQIYQYIQNKMLKSL